MVLPEKTYQRGRAFVDTLDKPKRKAEPSWTHWNNENEKQSLRGHLGRTKTKGRAFMDALEK